MWNLAPFLSTRSCRSLGSRLETCVQVGPLPLLIHLQHRRVVSPARAQPSTFGGITATPALAICPAPLTSQFRAATASSIKFTPATRCCHCCVRVWRLVTQNPHRIPRGVQARQHNAMNIEGPGQQSPGVSSFTSGDSTLPGA
ncbi:hypothetical protein SKAU_G00302980 [Synaphobranchus kaupii]|uniref:Uncharacterized protein n=1 Tax=Synaphobranchus kaupii TaxID=118154 RepID=A0A9Q1ILC3_SYNKA|nr:hypothetical protein SKAU_G00302980 [Synaphobranchus kaupii]